MNPFVQFVLFTFYQPFFAEFFCCSYDGCLAYEELFAQILLRDSFMERKGEQIVSVAHIDPAFLKKRALDSYIAAIKCCDRTRRVIG